MSEPKTEARFFGVSVPAGQPFHTALNQDWATLDKSRPDIIRRLECYTCPHLVTYNYPTDEQGNILPKHVCGILDLENALIERENAKRHPTEQLLFKNCVFGPIPEPPYFPRNPGDIIPR